MAGRVGDAARDDATAPAVRRGIFQRVSFQLLAMIAFVVTLGIAAMVIVFSERQRDHILSHNADAMRQVTESVIQSLQSVMLAGYADIAQVYAEHLKEIRGVDDFRILRPDGREAFRDNQTIREVNAYLGGTVFEPRDREVFVPVLEPDDPALRTVLEERRIVSDTERRTSGGNFLTFLAPIETGPRCAGCHPTGVKVRGIVKLTSSLAAVEQDIAATRRDALAVLAIAVAVILAITTLLVRQLVLRPVGAVSRAMAEAASGRLDHEVPVLGRDELAEMASSFNAMMHELNRSYVELDNEQNKLSTLILSAREGIVATDASGRVVLVNDAACEILGKDRETIESDGFEQLFDDPGALADWLMDPLASRQDHPFEYRGRYLHANIAVIHDADGALLGRTALFRDMSRERQMEERLRKLSLTDGLTGLSNRRCLDERLAREMLRTRITMEALSLLMIDVDHFKDFNDRHGHEQGDRVLQAVAACMGGMARATDLACRYGGEEFTMILPNTPLEGARELAERLREAISALDVDGLGVTVSIGAACIDRDIDTPEALIEAADRRLYLAKRAGRDRVVAEDRQGAAV